MQPTATFADRKTFAIDVRFLAASTCIDTRLGESAISASLVLVARSDEIIEH